MIPILLISSILTIFIILLIKELVDRKKKKQKQEAWEKLKQIQTEQIRLDEIQKQKIVEQTIAENERLKNIEDEKYESVLIINTYYSRVDKKNYAILKRYNSTHAYICTTKPTTVNSHFREMKEVISNLNWHDEISHSLKYKVFCLKKIEAEQENQRLEQQEREKQRIEQELRNKEYQINNKSQTTINHSNKVNFWSKTFNQKPITTSTNTITNYQKIQNDNHTKIDINPQKLFGNWKEGYALDFHTTSSTPIGVNQTTGRTMFDTIRPKIAEELYRYKYKGESYRVSIISKPVSIFLNKYKHSWHLDLIIPIPPSDLTRTFQPVYELAKVVGQLSNLPVKLDLLKKTKSTSQLKSIDDSEQRKLILKGAFDIPSNSLTGKNVLLFDDLYRSGETLKAVVDVLKNKGNAQNLFVLTVTKTRSKK